MSSSPTYRLWSWPKIQILQVYPQGASLVCSSRVSNMGVYEPFWYLTMYPGDSYPMGTSLMGIEDYERDHNWFPRLVPREVFLVEVWFPGWTQ